MIIIPAIDLLDGQCVRLYKGRYSESVAYKADPVEMALSFRNSGCRRLHVVDLDAARGQKNNRETIKKIRESTDAVIETGGGIRTEKDIEELLAIGVERLILGTVFAKNPEIAGKWTQKFGRHFIAGIDSLNGEVKIAGWEQGTKIRDTDLAAKAAEFGIISIIYTNIDKDGTMEGPDIEGSIRIAEASGLPVIVSGGISSNEDLGFIHSLNRPELAGVITGKAVYENKIDLISAVEQYQSASPDGDIW